MKLLRPGDFAAGRFAPVRGRIAPAIEREWVPEPPSGAGCSQAAVPV
jgi:hypothetical protein